MFKKLKRIFVREQQKSFFIFPVLSGIFLALACNQPSFWLLGLAGLIPLIHFSYRVNSLRKALVGFLIFGLIFSGGVIVWVWSLNIFVWTGITNFWLITIIKFSYWFLFLSLMGVLSFLILGWLFFKLKTGTWRDFLLLPSLWILAEFTRAYFYSLITFSSEGLIGAHNTFGFVGYILASNFNLLQLAGFGGVYLLSFILVFINLFFYGIIFLPWKKELKIILMGAILIVLIFPVNSFLSQEKNRKDEVRVGVLQTSRDSFFRTDSESEMRKFNNHLNLLRQVQKNSDIVVFPEDSRFIRRLFEYDLDLLSFYKKILGNQVKMIVDSSRIKNEENKTKQRLYFYNLTNGEFNKYDKNLLSPGGEVMPVFFSSLVKLIGFGDWAEKLGEGKYTKGEKIELGQFENKKIAGLFCFEINSPGLVRKMALKEAQLFFNPTSHASFQSDKNLYNQIINMTKVRAVENGRYFIQAGNHVSSSIVTFRGEVFSNPEKQDSVFHKKVYFKDHQTFFAEVGNWPLALSLGLVLIFGLKKVDNKNR